MLPPETLPTQLPSISIAPSFVSPSLIAGFSAAAMIAILLKSRCDQHIVGPERGEAMFRPAPAARSTGVARGWRCG